MAVIKKINLAVFDIDDTLYPFGALHVEAINFVAEYIEKEFGIPKQGLIDEYNAELARQMKLYPQLVNCHSRTIRFQRIAEHDKRLPLGMATQLSDMYWNTLLEKMTPFPGIVELFRSLKASGIKIGICTDMTADWQIKKLVAIGLADYVDFVVSSEEAGVEKPSRQAFELCLEKGGNCDPSTAIMFGDNYKKDIVGALGVGMNAVWYNPNKNVLENKASDVIELNSYVDIEKTLIIEKA